MKATLERLKTIIAEIANERIKQDKKWGEQNHHPVLYMNILLEEVGEAAKEANDIYWDSNKADVLAEKMRGELIQVAAVAVAMVECLDRGKWKAKLEGK